MVVRPRANFIRVTMLVPFWENTTGLVIKTSAARIADNTHSLRKNITVSGNSFRYRFGLACDAGIPFIGIGNFPSAPLVSAMNA